MAETESLTTSQITGYFSKINRINEDILTEERTLAKHLGTRWEDMPEDRKDLVLDFLFVNDDIRQQYENVGVGEKMLDVKESFPRRNLNSGQKINVDFESDLWTWRDEHSGPFSWYSKSQQDLTLADLEPDCISKPQPKTSHTDDGDDAVRASTQFNYPSSMLCHDIIDRYQKNKDKVSVSPTPSFSFPSKNGRLPAVSPADVKTVVEEQNSNGHAQQALNRDESPLEIKKDVEEKKEKAIEKGKRSRSPSPKKIFRTASLTKSSPKTSETDLINRDDVDTNDNNNVFSNTAMETQWSSFVGESHDPEPQQPAPLSQYGSSSQRGASSSQKAPKAQYPPQSQYEPSNQSGSQSQRAAAPSSQYEPSSHRSPPSQYEPSAQRAAQTQRASLSQPPPPPQPAPQPVRTAPSTLVMDRGSTVWQSRANPGNPAYTGPAAAYHSSGSPGSPLHSQNDTARLLPPATPPPAPPSARPAARPPAPPPAPPATLSPRNSSPDHNTALLPQNKQPPKATSHAAASPTQPAPATMQLSPQTKDDPVSSVPSSGFDFLDNW